MTAKIVALSLCIYSTEALSLRADQAMYKAKAAGKGRYAVAS
jgi:PleD family two-component response regulator